MTTDAKSLAEKSFELYSSVMERGQHFDADTLGDLQRDCEGIFLVGFKAALECEEVKAMREALRKMTVWADGIYLRVEHSEVNWKPLLNAREDLKAFDALAVEGK